MTFCLYKVFEFTRNRKIIEHISAHNRVSDRYYAFSKKRSVDYILTLLADSRSLSLIVFGKIFVVILHRKKKKTFDRVWLTFIFPNYQLVGSILLTVF